MNIIEMALESLNKGIKGFNNPQAPSGNPIQQTLDQVPLLKNIRGFNEGAFGRQAVNNPEVYFQGGNATRPLQDIASPLPEEDIADTPEKRDLAMKILANHGQNVVNTTPHQGVLGAVFDNLKNSAEAYIPRPTPTLAPQADDFEKAALPVLNKYQIPPSVGFGMKEAEGGKLGQNNPYNINATDANPHGASNYSSMEEGVRAFAELLAKNPRYAKAYAQRSNPTKMMKEIQNAGYAGDPADWQQRKNEETPNFPYKTYSDFVEDTPGWKRYYQ